VRSYAIISWFYSVVCIGRNTSNNNNITKVTFGLYVETIGNRAFSYNKLAGELRIPSSVVSIGEYAFYGNELTKVDLGIKVETIGNFAFNGNSLTTITIGVNVVIGNDTAMGNYGTAFLTLYNGNGKLAGTYNYAGGAWTKQ